VGFFVVMVLQCCFSVLLLHRSKTNSKGNNMSTIKLQGIGSTTAKMAQELKVGDMTVWNSGGTAKVLAVVSETAKFITFKIEESTGVYTRRLKKDRLVGVS